MNSVTAVIVDMDGVLIDSAPLSLRATQAALGPRGCSFTARDQRAFLAATDAELIRVLRILFDLSPTTAELIDHRRHHLASLIRAEAQPLPGVSEVLRQLQAVGMRLALTSPSAPAVIRAVIETVGLEGAFRAVVSGDEVARGKPAPDAFIMAARRLEVSPERCLVIGDSRDGALAGKAAGMTVAVIPGPATSHEDFSPADLMLPSLEGLGKALGQNFPEVGLP